MEFARGFGQVLDVCGIAGIWAAAPWSTEDLSRGVEAMAERQRARGPDDAGVWCDAGARLALGHRRLSVVDLTDAGHQPMHSASGRYVISYNGEIYNHGELRLRLPPELRGRLVGRSDTEVLLACVDAWGLTHALESLVGMFAFALWDRQERALHLVRDRFGIKPLYYGASAEGLAFASQLDAVTLVRGFDSALDRDALREYFRYGYVPAPASIYRDARKVPPGVVVSFRAPRIASADLRVHYDAADRARIARASPFVGSRDDAVDALDERLRAAVGARLLADVPVGAFLSGGVDSSAVVAVACAVSSSPLRTFTIGSDEPAYDEAASAERVARHLGTAHTTLTATSDDAMRALREVPAIFDEPFADSSQIPTLLVSRLARRSVTVALSGDGGDEVFGGYNRHVFGPRVWRAARWVPKASRRAVGAWLRSVDQRRWDDLYRELRSTPIARLLPDVRVPGQKAHKLGVAFAQPSDADLYVAMCSQWQAPEALVPGGGARGRAVAELAALTRTFGRTEGMMLRDMQTYLPDDVLTKVDRASMSVSLEARVPLLDHRLVELAWSLPTAWKVEGGAGKRILRQLLARYVPPGLFERAKAGFGVPVGDWLRGPLRGWADELLSDAVGDDDGVRMEPVRRVWADHLSGRGDHASALWTVLSFRAWRAIRPSVGARVLR